MIGGRIIVVLSLVLSPVLTIPSPNQPRVNSTGFIQPKNLVTTVYRTLSAGQVVHFASPGFPVKYQPNANLWLLFEVADQETEYLDVRCPIVNIQSSPNCHADSLIIAYSNTIKSHCGNKRPPAHFKADKYIAFRFRTDGSHQSANGFFCQVIAKRKISDPTSCNCGQANTNRIVGGVPLGVNEHPWLVAIVAVGSPIPSCGGSLYNTEWVITAAHCIAMYKDSSLTTVDASSIEILLGMHNRITQIPRPTRRSVSQIIPHGQYRQRPKLNNDIALMKMSSPVTYSISIRPVCLPPSNADYTERKSYTTGWGELSKGGIRPNVPYKVEMPIRSHQECEAVYGPKNYVTDNIICAGNKYINKDVCMGDSGAPLTVEVLGRHYLAGVASIDVYFCGVYPFLTGYMRVANYISFISHIAGAQCA